MAETAVVDVDGDSTEREQHDSAGPTRRRIKSTPMGRGERVRAVDCEIGDFEYTVRCPKLIVWQGMAEVIEEQTAGSRSDRRRKGERGPAAAGRVTTDRIRLTSAISTFLRGCMTAQDWQALNEDLTDPGNDLDTPDLWAAGLALVAEFRPDMEEQATRIGMKIPAVIGKLLDQVGDDGLLKNPPPQDEPEPGPVVKARTAARGKARARK
jgi:hypothetical protein